MEIPKNLPSDPFPIFAEDNTENKSQTWSDSFAHSNKKEEIEKKEKMGRRVQDNSY